MSIRVPQLMPFSCVHLPNHNLLGYYLARSFLPPLPTTLLFVQQPQPNLKSTSPSQVEQHSLLTHVDSPSYPFHGILTTGLITTPSPFETTTLNSGSSDQERNISSRTEHL